MIAYKGFLPGLICRDYQFKMGLNVTEKANCAHNGFHCAEDPLDCLSYYGDINHAEYYIVDAGGDIDEDGVDSKISCTELTILKRLTKKELFLHGLAFMADHPKRKWNSNIKADKAEAWNGYAAVRGADPTGMSFAVRFMTAVEKYALTIGACIASGKHAGFPVIPATIVTVAIRQAGSMARAFPAWNRRSCSALALCSGYAPIR